MNTTSTKTSRTVSKKLNVALWVAQILVAAIFLFAGIMKLTLPLDALKGPIAFPGFFLRFLGVCEVLGAIGLLLPRIVRFHTELTAYAALGLALIMIGAVSTTVATAPNVAGVLVPFITGCLATFIAYYRWPTATKSAKHVLGIA